MSLFSRLAHSSQKRAFTLLELIVVIVILGVLAAIAIPTFSRVIQNSQDAATKATLSAMMKDAQALVAFQDGTSWDEAMDIAASETATAFAPGVSAAGRYAKVKSTTDEPVLNSTMVYTESAGKVVASLRSPSTRICVGSISATSYTAPSCFDASAGVSVGAPSTNLVSDIALGLVSLPGLATPSSSATPSPSASLSSPAAPVLSSSFANGNATLSWPSVHSASTPVNTHTLYRGTGASEAAALADLASASHYAILGNVVDRLDKDLTAGTYCYALVANGVAGDSPRSAPSCATVAPTSPMVAASLLSATHSTSCAVQSGALTCWGDNTYGQIGDGTKTHSNVPVSVTSMSSGVTAVSTGNIFTCAIKASAVYCWGDGSQGSFGTGQSGASASSLTPVPVPALSSGVTAISVNKYGMCAIKAGDLYCSGSAWKYASTSTLVLSSGVESVSVGTDHTCAVQSGSAKCWGYNSHGQIGDGTWANDRPTPTQVSGMSTGVTSVTAGTQHSCGVKEGALYCWGVNAAYQLGDGTTTLRTTPVPVSNMSEGVTVASAGNYNGYAHTCAIKAGDLYCWGGNTSGMIGNNGGNSQSPVKILTAGVTALATGNAHTCALQASAVKCWGHNQFGQVGDATFESRSTPVAVAG